MPMWDQFSRPRMAAGGGYAPMRAGGSDGSTLSRMMSSAAPMGMSGPGPSQRPALPPEPRPRPWPQQRQGLPAGPGAGAAPEPAPAAPEGPPSPGGMGGMQNALANYQNFMLNNYQRQFGPPPGPPPGPPQFFAGPMRGGYGPSFMQQGGPGRMSIPAGAPPQGIRPLQPMPPQGMQSMQRGMAQPQPFRPMSPALAGRR